MSSCLYGRAIVKQIYTTSILNRKKHLNNTNRRNNIETYIFFRTFINVTET